MGLGIVFEARKCLQSVFELMLRCAITIIDLNNDRKAGMALIISEDTVWSSNQIITLTEDVQIAQGVTLTIEPNVKIIGNGHEIMTFGTLYAGQPGTNWRVEFSNVNFQFGNDHSNPGRIEIYNADIASGSFLDANGHARYGSFQVHGSSFDGTDGFYIWHPTSESEFWGNTFSNSRGMSIGTDYLVNVQNNAFHNSSPAYNGQATIVSWASYGADDNIRVVDNTFYQSASYVLEVADGYNNAHLFANGNFIEAANGSGGEQFVLDIQDSLTRTSDISLGVEATEPHPETPSINRPPSGYVSISGATQEGEVLTALTDSIVDPDGMGDFHFQWLRDGQEVEGETARNYTLTQADVGSEISVMVGYDDYGLAENSEITNQTRSLTINGASTAGGNSSFQLRFATTVPDGESLLQFRIGASGWYVDVSSDWPSNLSGGDVGNRVIQTLNAEGIISYADAAQYFRNQTTFEPFEQQIFSGSSQPISNANDTPTGGVTIFGAATLRETITSDISSLADPDGLGSLSYQWLRDGSTISNATNESYTLTEADVGSEISLRVSYTDDQGTLETVTSGATSPVVGDLVLIGNGQDNALIGGSFNDRLVGRAGDDTLSGNKGDDILLGGQGADTAAGGVGADSLKGNGGSDRLVGNGGNDLVLGGGGRDSLLGGGGDDTLSGGSGHDLLQGQRGHDEATGGRGRDTFVFNRGDGADTITDFELGIDNIQIGRGASRFGQLNFEQVGDDVLVSFRNVVVTVENTAVDDLAVSDHFLFV